MANIVDRSYPGDLTSARGDTFLTTFNTDRWQLYTHADELQNEVESLTGSFIGTGTMPDNTASITLDSGQVVVAQGYRAAIGAIFTTASELRQAYAQGVDNYVFLGYDALGETLRISQTNSPGYNEILIAFVDSTGTLDTEPSGKPYARMGLGDGSGWANILDAEYITVADTGNADTEFEVQHNLARVPVGYLVVRRSAAGVVYDGTSTWTTSSLYLKCSAANVNITILVW